MTQDEVVAATKLRDRTGLSAIENGKRDIGVTELPVFARVLKVPIAYFFEGDLSTANDQEAALLEWYRVLSDDRKKRVFEFIEDQAKRDDPLVIGERRDPKRSTPDKGRRDED